MRTWCLVGAGKEGTPTLPLWLAAQASLVGQRRGAISARGHKQSFQAGLWAVWGSQERRSPGVPGEGPQTLARVGGKESIYPGGLWARPSWGEEGAGRHGSSHKSGVHILDVRPGMRILPNLCRGWGWGRFSEPASRVPGKWQVLNHFPFLLFCHQGEASMGPSSRGRVTPA